MKISEHRECDVLVCGGGTAGLGAAVAAARNGARTTLLERHGFCGGICVSSLVHTFDGARSCRDNSQFVVGGIPREVIDALAARSALALDDNPPETLNFDPEAMKLVSDRLLSAAGVRLYYHLFATGATRDGDRVSSVLAAGKEGLWELKAKVIIDTTGDGDVSYSAGAAYEKHEQLQTMSQHFRVGGLTGDRSWHELEKDCRRALDRAFAEGRAPKYGGPWVIRIRAGEMTLNCTRLYGDGSKTEDLTHAERQGREDLTTMLEVFRQDIPDLRSSYILTSGPSIGVRETRRILGDYQVTADDVKECRSMPDPIALGSWPIDIHPSDGRVGVHPHKEDPPAPYPIPVRALLVRNIANVLVAGRCLSATHEAHGSTRRYARGAGCNKRRRSTRCAVRRSLSHPSESGSDAAPVKLALWFLAGSAFALDVATVLPPGTVTRRDIPYGTHPRQRLDLYRPAQLKAKYPVLFFIHGGGWVGMSKDDVVERHCRRYVEKGFAVVNVEYRLASDAPAPAAVLDVRAAGQWLIHNAKRNHLDLAHLVVSGNSAGGHLALMVFAPMDPAVWGPSLKPSAIVNLYGICDVFDLLQGPNQRGYAVKWFAGVPDPAKLARSLSPLEYVQSRWPPVLTVHGDRDDSVPYAQAVALTKRLVDTGNEAELITVPGAKHGFPEEQWVQLYPQIFSFLSKHMTWTGSR